MMPNMDYRVMLHQMVQQNPQMLNNPQMQNIYNILMNGDSEAGKQMAMNLCQSYGMTPDNFMMEAQSYIQQKFQGFHQRR